MTNELRGTIIKQKTPQFFLTDGESESIMLKVSYYNFKNENELLEIARAISSPNRLDILKALNTKSLTIKQLSELLNQPVSSTSMNVDILEQCGLIRTERQISQFGKIRLCSRACDSISIDLQNDNSVKENEIKIALPLGSYFDCNVQPDCGIATKTGNLGIDSENKCFFMPERHMAQLIWFSKGYLEYRIAKSAIPPNAKRMEISFETCSEAPFYRNDYKSDITLWLNGTEIGTYTSLGDYGDRRGRLNPPWWPDSMTQYGMLVTWRITENGCKLGAEEINGKKFNDFNIFSRDYISIKIGVKKDAKYQGGINLFGKEFGDHAQDILVKFSW